MSAATKPCAHCGEEYVAKWAVEKYCKRPECIRERYKKKSARDYAKVKTKAEGRDRVRRKR